jgi:GTP-binding protein
LEATFLKSAFKVSHYPPPDRPEIAFAGRSNVGKSSLINTLLNRKRMARTSSTPGRTQAINFFAVGERLNFVDLPGYGFARVPLQVKESWKGMVESYLKKRDNLRAVVVILDIRRAPAEGDKDLLSWLTHHGIPQIIVLTKADKLSRNRVAQQAKEIMEQLKEISGERPVIFSAKTRMGRDEVWGKIDQAIGSLQGRRP